MKKVHSNLLDIDIYADETEEGLVILRHSELERTVQLQTRFKVSYNPVYMHLPDAVIECCIEDTESGTSIIKVGETNKRTLQGDISTDYPGTIAYQRAFDRAAIAILQINEKKIFSNLEMPNAVTAGSNRPAAEVRPEAVKETAGNDAELSDDTVIVLGKFAGQPYGKVKDLKEFKDFIEWVKEKHVTFADAERTAQVKLLIKQMLS